VAEWRGRWRGADKVSGNAEATVESGDSLWTPNITNICIWHLVDVRKTRP
jgi:hypothetical protein